MAVVTKPNSEFYDNPYGVTLFQGNAANTITGLSTIIAACKDLGVTWIRFNSNWTNRETSLGTWVWTDVDDLVSQANAARINLLFVIDCNKPPSFRQNQACSATGAVPSATDVEAYATALVARYSSTQIQGVEIGNEGYNLLHNDAVSSSASNCSFTTATTYNPCCDPKWYTAVMQGVAPIVRSGIPGVIIGSGAILEHSSTAKQRWLQSFHDNGLYSLFDYVNFHYYNGAGTPPWTITDCDHGNFDTSRYIMQQTMQDSGDASPIWLTEAGWTTSTVGGHNASDVVGYGQQIQFFQYEYDQARLSKSIKKFFFYTLQLASGTGIAQSDGESLLQGSADIATKTPTYQWLKSYISQYPKWR